MKKWIILIAIAVLTVTLLITGYIVFSVRGIQLSVNLVNLEEGDKTEVQCELVPENAIFGKDVKWTSSDVSVARVVNGTITGISSGECIITASTGKYLAECHVTVRSAKEVQAEMVDRLIKHIKDNSDMDNSESGAYLMVIGRKEKEINMLALKGNVVAAIYLDTSDGTSKQTMVLFEGGNLQRANVNQVNTMIFDGETLKTNASGSLIPDKYKRGDRIEIEHISMENAPEGAQIGVTDEFQKGVDLGTEKALEGMGEYLNQHTELGSLKKLGFQLD